MDNYNVNEILEKLIDLTKNNSLTWNYLDDKEVICEELKLKGVCTPYDAQTLELLSAFSPTQLFDSSNSFIAEINRNYVIIYSIAGKKAENRTLSERLVFKLVPRTFRDVFTYQSHKQNGTLLRLQSLVKSYFPSAEDIAKDILDM